MKKWQFFVPYGCRTGPPSRDDYDVYKKVYPPDGWYFPDGVADVHFILSAKRFNSEPRHLRHALEGVYNIRRVSGP